MPRPDRHALRPRAFPAGPATAPQLMPLTFRQSTIRGIAVAPRTPFDRMKPCIAQHGVRPAIDQVHAFEDAVRAFGHLARAPFGKVVIGSLADASVSQSSPSAASAATTEGKRCIRAR